MLKSVKLKLTCSRYGRAALHLGCIFRGGPWRWHWEGVCRELTKKSLVSFGVVLTALSALHSAAAESTHYSEPFRPQFHFSPEKNWMNDPNGLVFYEGEYHLFYQYNPFGDKWGHMSWGHAVSTDMVHWKHLPLALAEADNVMIFSGSAVVDWKNSSGFGRDGKPPMVAIYTGYNTTNNLQYQCIAYSNDKGRTWTKYAGNPVINVNSKDFRDPKVQWDEKSKRWLMTVSLSAEHKVCFYSSTNLKDWMLLSQFGPAGATSGVWECPDLCELPVEGTKESRWVLVVNIGSGSVAGGSGGQYFIGHFDGTRFTPDKEEAVKQTPEFVPDGEVIADFEGGDYGDWHSTGEAFSSRPAQGRLANQNPVEGFKGHGLVNSFYKGDETTGTLTSSEFKISKSFLNFLIGGGASHDTRIDLMVDGKVVRTASGDDNERLAWKSWDVREFAGRRATLQIVDEAKGGWGHISVDQIMEADAPARATVEPALWLDYGPDYYAAVSWSGVPQNDGRRLWIGWLSNWQYGQDVPTSPWRSAMSIPRSVSLRKTSEGIRLVQNPIRELSALRQKHFQFTGGDIAQANEWLAKNPVQSSPLECIIEFAPAKIGTEGIELFKTAKAALVVGVDRKKGTVFVDRSNSGNVSFNPKFAGRFEAPLDEAGAKVKLHVFVDANSVEVFVNDGEAVLTSLVFPAEEKSPVSLISSDPGSKVNNFELWPLKSSWR